MYSVSPERLVDKVLTKTDDLSSKPSQSEHPAKSFINNEDIKNLSSTVNGVGNDTTNIGKDHREKSFNHTQYHSHSHYHKVAYNNHSNYSKIHQSGAGKPTNYSPDIKKNKSMTPHNYKKDRNASSFNTNPFITAMARTTNNENENLNSNEINIMNNITGSGGARKYSNSSKNPVGSKTGYNSVTNNQNIDFTSMFLNQPKKSFSRSNKNFVENYPRSGTSNLNNGNIIDTVLGKASYNCISGANTNNIRNSAKAKDINNCNATSLMFSKFLKGLDLNEYSRYKIDSPTLEEKTNRRNSYNKHSPTSKSISKTGSPNIAQNKHYPSSTTHAQQQFSLSHLNFNNNEKTLTPVSGSNNKNFGNLSPNSVEKKVPQSPQLLINQNLPKHNFSKAALRS